MTESIILRIILKVQKLQGIHKENPTRCNNVSKFYMCLTMSTSYTSNNPPGMKNQRLPVQF
jgi:hypothetical protein